MTLRAWIVGFAVLLTIVTPSRTVAATLSSIERAPISQERVSCALAAAHLVVRDSQIQMLSETISRTATSQLKVTRIEKWNDASALVRIRCAKSSECMPFYVVVHWPMSTDRDLALAPPTNNKGPIFVDAHHEPLVRAGDQAVLITNTSKFHATTPIICLQTGSQGQKVRVATLNRKKIAMAEVIDTGVLKGSFSAE
jgi:hypothetical protein